MTILDRFLFQRLLTLVLFFVMVFTILWLSPEILFRAIQGMFQGKLTLAQGVDFLIYHIPSVLLYCLPIAMLGGSVFLFRQLSLSTELTALLAAGISTRRLLLPIGMVGLLASLLFFATQEYLNPEAASALRKLNEDTHFSLQDLKPPLATFVEKDTNGAIEKFFLFAPKSLKVQNKFIVLFYQGVGADLHIHQILTATQGWWDTHNNRWLLKDGIEYTLDPQGIYRRVRPFQTQWVKTSPVIHGLLTFPSNNPTEFRMKELERYVRLLRRGQQTEDALFYQVRFYQRYTQPLAPLFFALVGVGIGVERLRSRRHMSLLYAASLLLFYNILIPAFTTLGSIGLLPAMVAAILPLALSTLAAWGIFKLRHQEC